MAKRRSEKLTFQGENGTIEIRLSPRRQGWVVRTDNGHFARFANKRIGLRRLWRELRLWQGITDD